MKPPALLPKNEWNFSKCPEGLTRACLFYETARELEDWRGIVAEYRSVGVDWNRDKVISASLNKENFEIGPNGSPLIRFPFISLFTYFPEWPQTPFLSLPHSTRSKFSEYVDDSRWETMLDPVVSLGLDEPIRTIFRRKTRPIDEPCLEPIVIDWSQNDETLCKWFKKWLQMMRGERKPCERRGGTSPRDILRWLTAQRLLGAMKWKDASELYQKTNGKPLYEEQTGWLHARNKFRKFSSILDKHLSIDRALIVFSKK